MSAQTIYFKLVEAGMSPEGACAMMGNMWAESGLKSNNVQDNCPIGDRDYTYNVEQGIMTRWQFMSDRYGYGLCQWTYPTRKRALLTFARAEGASIGSLMMQTDFCIKEMKEGYAGLWAYLCGAPELFTAVSRICREYERPAVNNISERLKYAEAWYTALKGVGSAAADNPAAAFWPPRTIAKGMSGADVTVWQALMVARGYECSVTGAFDEKTREATVKYQTAAGLSADGIPGPVTWAAGLSIEKGGV